MNKTNLLSDEIENTLILKYPYNSVEQLKILNAVRNALSIVTASGLYSQNDSEFLSRLKSENRHTYMQLISEVLVAIKLRESGLAISRDLKGPDFYFSIDENIKIWIEIVTPEPQGIPSGWLNSTSHNESPQASTVPNDEILLRWTASLIKKSKKFFEYRKLGTVGTSDICIIAINGTLLQNGIPCLRGISQFPFALEAAAPIGSRQISIAKKEGQVEISSHSYKENIKNKNEAVIDKKFFFNRENDHISAIWALDVNENILIQPHGEMELIHNPFSKNPMPKKMIPSNREYTINGSVEDFEILID